MLKPPDAGDYVPYVKLKTAGRYSLTERPPWGWPPSVRDLSDAHTARLAFAGWGWRPWPVFFSLSYGVSLEPLEAPRGENGPFMTGKTQTAKVRSEGGPLTHYCVTGI